MDAARWQVVKEKMDHALALDAPQRSSYLDELGGVDASLRAEVESLLAWHFAAGSRFLENPPINPYLPNPGAAPGKRFGPYEVTELLGVGGMGEVYRAHDVRLNRDVAIKLVRTGMGSATLSERFRNEQQILAGLEHPNITRLLDVGTSEDGLPYIAMELVEGQPIDKYCDDLKLTISQRLKLFREVCSAVHYAHRHLVVHRDLKPTNILVTNDGAVKLLDFGIAKLAGAGQEPIDATATMMRVLTPAYASPEQVKGEAITTASDVYSLGVVLFELLTGHRPYKVTTRTPAEIANAVCEQQPDKPSVVVMRAGKTSGPPSEAVTPETVSRTREGSPEKLQRRLCGDLDNIALMALRKEPEHRYQSASDFNEDLRRHLEGQPVVAAGTSWKYRASKFAVRHKAAITATALIVLATILGVAATLREARIARANQLRAERRFNDVRKLANSLVGEIQTSVMTLPGSIPARKLILERALEYLDSLSKEAGGDQELQRDLADTYLQIGQMQGGVPGVPSLGDTQGGLQSFQKMLAIRQEVAKANPGSITDAVRLSNAYRYIADLQAAELGDVKGGYDNIMKAVEITESLNKTHPNDKSVKSQLFQNYEKLADVYGGANGATSNLANFQAALDTHYKALALAEPIVAETPDDKWMKYWLADLNFKIQNDLIQTGDRPEAMRRVNMATDVVVPMAKSGDALSRYILAVADGGVATLHLMNGNFAQALDYANKGADIVKAAVKADPQDADSALQLGVTRAMIGYIEFRQGRNQGIDELRGAAADLEKIVANNPYSMNKSSLGSVFLQLGLALERKQDWKGALEAYSRALQPFQTMADHDPADLNDRLRAAGITNRLASVHLRIGDADRALSELEHARTVIEPAAATKPVVLIAVYLEYENYAGMGDIHTALARKTKPSDQGRHLDEARTWYRKALDTAARIPNKAIIDPAGFESPDIQTIASRLDACEQELRNIPQVHH